MQNLDRNNNTSYNFTSPYKHEAADSDSDDIFRQLKMDPFKYHLKPSNDSAIDLSSDLGFKENIINLERISSTGKGV